MFEASFWTFYYAISIVCQIIMAYFCGYKMGWWSNVIRFKTKDVPAEAAANTEGLKSLLKDAATLSTNVKEFVKGSSAPVLPPVEEAKKLKPSYKLHKGSKGSH